MTFQYVRFFVTYSGVAYMASHVPASEAIIFDKTTMSKKLICLQLNEFNFKYLERYIALGFLPHLR